MIIYKRYHFIVIKAILKMSLWSVVLIKTIVFVAISWITYKFRGL